MQPNKPGENGTQPVMDVQKPAPPAGGSGPAVIQPNGSSLNRPATMEYTRPRADEDSASTGMGGSDFSGPVMPGSTDSAMPGQSKMPQKPKKSKKLFATLLIIIGILGIAGAGVYFYLAYQEETPEPAPQPVVTEPAEQAIEATPEGVDATLDKIDESLQDLDDTADFPSNELSDDSLGL